MLRAYHAYGAWLISISWWRFALFSLLLLIGMSILQNVLPTWTTTEVVDAAPPEATPKAPAKAPAVRIAKPTSAASSPERGVSITIDADGVRIAPRSKSPASAGLAASAAAAETPAAVLPDSIEIHLPPGATSTEIQRAVAEAKREIEVALAEARSEAAEAEPPRRRIRTHTVGIGEELPNLALLIIVASAILKISYKRTRQAEVRAVHAEETAEAEQLKRQVVEARMAAMQAQVEPHFLFNTLASIEHLIETDARRASQMQRNLIALLRAAMPTMREANGTAGAVRDLGRELAVIRPYLEILKVRMEERLGTAVQVPEGLNSAEFPPMMLQSLVENAIKHGLEPKPEGGTLRVAAEIVDGKLAVTVADTGLGFGKAATAGTGIGLSNIRERLALLYGTKATLTVAENPPGGTVVTISVPYRVYSGDNTAAPGAAA